MINQYVFDNILGVPEKVGYIKQAPPPPKNLAEENPHANFVCDVMREKQIRILHYGTIAGSEASSMKVRLIPVM